MSFSFDVGICRKGGRKPLPQSGMAVACITSIQSCGSTSGNKSWGGARNKRDRVSDRLTYSQCKGMLAAGRYSELIGCRFNRHWSVHYEKAGISEIEAPTFIGRLLKFVREYARRHCATFTCVWSREGGKGKGGHVHILMHLPAGLSLKGRTRKWIRLSGGDCRVGVSHIRSIGGTLAAAETGGDVYQLNADIVRNYLLKYTDRETADALGLPLYGWTGAIIGKRCGWTQNIGARARMSQS